MTFNELVNHILNEAFDPHMGKLFKVGDIVQLKHAQLTNPTRLFRTHKPGDKFEVIGRKEGASPMRPFYIKSVDTGETYSTVGYHIQSINKPLKKVCRVPKRLKGTISCSNCSREFNLEMQGKTHRDHCPHCLCSVHIDSKPGNREVWCGEGTPCTSNFIHATLRPIGKSSTQPIYILYRCEKCGKLKTNVSAYDDNIDLINALPIKDFKIKGYKIS